MVGWGWDAFITVICSLYVNQDEKETVARGRSHSCFVSGGSLLVGLPYALPMWLLACCSVW